MIDAKTLAVEFKGEIVNRTYRKGVMQAVLVTVLAINTAAGPDTRVRPAGVVGNLAGVSISNADRDARETMAWALDRFDAAGLDLPPLMVTVHNDRAECSGAAGLFFWGPPARVELCAVTTGAGSRLIVLHELSHAWLELVADQSVRDRFLEHRGLDTWRDPAVPTWRWGQEQAAEVLAWGLMDEPIRLATIYDATAADLATAFEAMAGQPPLHERSADRAGNGQPPRDGYIADIGSG